MASIGNTDPINGEQTQAQDRQLRKIVKKHALTIEMEDLDEVIREKSLHGRVKFDREVVYRIHGDWDSDYFNFEDSDEETPLPEILDVHNVKILVPFFKTSFIKLKITLSSDDETIYGEIREVRNDRRGSTILGNTQKDAQILKSLEFVHMHPFVPRDSYDFDLEAPAPRKVEMIYDRSVKGCIGDSTTFSSPYLEFCVCVTFTDAFVKFLKFCKHHSPVPFDEYLNQRKRKYAKIKKDKDVARKKKAAEKLAKKKEATKTKKSPPEPKKPKLTQ